MAIITTQKWSKRTKCHTKHVNCTLGVVVLSFKVKRTSSSRYYHDLDELLNWYYFQ